MHPHRIDDRGGVKRQEHETRQLPVWPVVDSLRCSRLTSAPPWSTFHQRSKDPQSHKSTDAVFLGLCSLLGQPAASRSAAGSRRSCACAPACLVLRVVAHMRLGSCGLLRMRLGSCAVTYCHLRLMRSEAEAEPKRLPSAQAHRHWHLEAAEGGPPNPPVPPKAGSPPPPIPPSW
jgi:hypothetical protein